MKFHKATYVTMAVVHLSSNAKESAICIKLKTYFSKLAEYFCSSHLTKISVLLETYPDVGTLFQESGQAHV